jgi:hypothetical protein
VPTDGLPSYILIENLEIRSAHPDYNYTDDQGNAGSYISNAASIFVEKADHLTIRNCVIHDSGNGIFTASQSSTVLIENNYIYGNGIVGSIFEHNTYTESNGIIYQYNRFGPLRAGAPGNNLKDRSAGLVVRYNWMEGGNRLLDMVDSGNSSLINDPDYSETYVYGNILIEEDGGNNQVLHYGGDSGITSRYRKGKLYFYHNTLYSIRAGNTTLMLLSTSDESADVRNNILHVTASGSRFALLAAGGTLDLSHNLLKPSWVNSHSAPFSGTINDDGTSIETTDPGFTDAAAYDFNLLATSLAIDGSTGLHPDANFTVDLEYSPHQSSQMRTIIGTIDIGAYEFMNSVLPVELLAFTAKEQGESIVLWWEVGQLYGIAGFAVEYSKDGRSWTALGFVTSTDNRPGTLQFDYRHVEPNVGDNFYRLKMIDTDGYFEYSPIITVNFNKIDEVITIHPNPSSGHFFIDGINSPCDIYVFDMAGRMLGEHRNIMMPSPFNVEHLPAGVYYLKIRKVQGGALVQKKIVKQ